MCSRIQLVRDSILQNGPRMSSVRKWFVCRAESTPLDPSPSGLVRSRILRSSPAPIPDLVIEIWLLGRYSCTSRYIHLALVPHRRSEPHHCRARSTGRDRPPPPKYPCHYLYITFGASALNLSLRFVDTASSCIASQRKDEQRFGAVLFGLCRRPGPLEDRYATHTETRVHIEVKEKRGRDGGGSKLEAVQR